MNRDASRHVLWVRRRFPLARVSSRGQGSTACMSVASVRSKEAFFVFRHRALATSGSLPASRMRIRPLWRGTTATAGIMTSCSTVKGLAVPGVRGLLAPADERSSRRPRPHGMLFLKKGDGIRKRTHYICHLIGGQYGMRGRVAVDAVALRGQVSIAFCALFANRRENARFGVSGCVFQ